MTRATRTAIALTALATIALTLTTAPTAQAADCTYNQAITGQCHQVLFTTQEAFNNDGLRTGSTSQYVTDNGRTYEAECNRISTTQTICVKGIEIAPPCQAPGTLTPDSTGRLFCVIPRVITPTQPPVQQPVPTFAG